MHRIQTGVLWVYTAFLALLAPSAPAQASSVSNTNNFYFKDFTADYYLARDDDGISHMKVVETLTAVFPNFNQNHGITRIIPFTNNDGQNLTMASDKHLQISAERNGIREEISDIQAGDGYFVVFIGDPDRYVTGEQIYTLTYEFENLILDFDGQQELYWDTNGNDWSQRFDQVTARVHLADDLADAFTGETSCYVGLYGENGQERCQTEVSGSTITFSASKLARYEGLTFDLIFQNGTFAPAPPHRDYSLVFATIAAGILGLGMFALMGMALRASRDRRQYYRGLFVKPEYTPPRDFTVAEMAKNYIGKGLKGDPRVATLLDLAVHHQIELVKSERNGAFGRKVAEWKVRLKTLDLNPEQEIVLQILAGSAAPLQEGQEITVKTRSATPTLAKLAERFGKQVDKALETKGLSVKYGKGSKVFHWSGILLACAVVWLVLWICALVAISSELSSFAEIVGIVVLPPLLITIVIGIFIASAIVYAKTAAMFTHTDKGLEYSRYLEGLREYIKLAEAERLQFLQSVKGADTSHQGIVRLYEKLLPYAVIFGLEKSWLDELSRYYEFDDVAAPSWYVGVGVFSAHEFSSALTLASNSISSSITHSTTSNSSSGFSGGGGGGFSGGGGGGGGGGGW